MVLGLKNIACVLALLLSMSCFSQSSSTERETPFNPKANYQTFGIKLRPLAWFFANSGGINLLLGTEVGFLKNNSVSADLYFNGEENSNDEDKRNKSVFLFISTVRSYKIQPSKNRELI